VGYFFHEEDNLLRDPVLYMLSIAFADGAFKNMDDIKSPEDRYMERLQFYLIRRRTGQELNSMSRA
jgi:hypothetical protein